MRRALPLPAICAALLLGACGSEQTPATPIACTEGPRVYLAALGDAPGEVLLEGETPISDCIVPDQASGDLSDVGATMISVVTRLNGEVQSDPSGVEAVRLGYLVGAIEEGATDTAGVHTDLIRRINSAARFSERGGTLPASFEQAYGSGYQAARDAG